MLDKRCWDLLDNVDLKKIYIHFYNVSTEVI